MSRKLILVLSIFISQFCFSCGIVFPSSFLDGDHVYLQFDSEAWIALLGKEYFPEIADQDFKYSSKTTSEADLSDFDSFLSKQGMSHSKRLEWCQAYKQFADACRNGKEADWDRELDGIDEFILYLKGVRELILDGESYPKSWLKLLALPEKYKHYRATWVYYMTGNYTKSDQDRMNCYQKVRELNLAGYQDTLGLAYATFGSAVEYITDPLLKVEAIVKQTYFQFSTTRSSENDYAIYKFYTNLSEADHAKLMKSPLGRGFLLAISMGGWNKSVEELQKIFKDWRPSGNQGLKLAGVVAWKSYTNGDFKLAKSYLELTSPDDMVAMWVRVKLALHDGDVKLATQVLEKWVTLYKALGDKDHVVRKCNINDASTFCFGSGAVDFPFVVKGELGLFYVTNQDFLQALHLFSEAGDLPDATVIAEQCLDLDELRKYVDQYKVSFISGLLSRRYFRAGEYELAYKYSKSKNRSAILTYSKLLQDGRNEGLSNDERALAYYNAAKIVRHHGMELAATEFYPDFATTEGRFKFCSVRDDWFKKFDFKPKQDWRYSDRFLHYRYQAADLMWKAIELSDSRALKAMAAYCGGQFINPKYAKEINKYYKVLVNTRCGLLSDAADAMRWFPKELDSWQSEETTNSIRRLRKECASDKPVSLSFLDDLVNGLKFSPEFFEYYQNKRRSQKI
jgi:hypothetical protein